MQALRAVLKYSERAIHIPKQVFRLLIFPDQQLFARLEKLYRGDFFIPNLLSDLLILNTNLRIEGLDFFSNLIAFVIAYRCLSSQLVLPV